MRAPKDVLEGLGFAANAAASASRSLKNELSGVVKEKVKECLRGMDLVTRVEYDELRLMVEKLRQEQEDRPASSAEISSDEKTD